VVVNPLDVNIKQVFTFTRSANEARPRACLLVQIKCSEWGGLGSEAL
jgi:hypothetical protein